jgi:signal transduction histidine kinase
MNAMKLSAWFRRQHALPLVVRLALTLLLVTAVAMAVLTSGLLVGVRVYEANRRSTELEGQADLYAALADQLIASSGNLQAVTPVLVSRSVGAGDVAVRVFGSAGLIFGASGSNAPFPSRAVASLLTSGVPQVLLSEDSNRRYSARRIEWNGRLVGVIEVSQSTTEEQRLYYLLRRVAVQSTLVAVVAAVVGAIIVARWLARLIRRLRYTAERVASGDLTERARERGPGEFVQLTRALNTMTDQLAERLARIEGQSAAQRRFYRDISHELRTPLMALGGYLENIEDAEPGPEQDRAIQSMQGEIARLGRLADELLRADSAPAIAIGPGQPIDLGELIAEITANLAGRARRGGVALRFDPPQAPLAVLGDRDRLKQAILNLLDNALRATPPGGSIAVTLLERPGQAVIDVLDSGMGIPEDLRAVVWERGVRGADGGSGLGLSIVRSIIEAHGGTALLLPSQEGAHFQLTLAADGR